MNHPKYRYRLFLLPLVGLLGNGGRAVAAPAIASPPQSLAVLAGQPAVFSIVATDSAPLSYQWWRGSEAIIGANGATYQIPFSTLVDSGAVLRSTVFSANGSVDSAPAVLTVNPVTPVAYVDWARAIPDATRRGPLDNPTGDGVGNLIKYALGLAPLAPVVPAAMPALRRNGEGVAYRFARDRRATGIVPSIERSVTLAEGTWAPVAIAKIADDGLTETWEAAVDTSGSTLFHRLRVAAQSPAESVPVFLAQPQDVTVAEGQSATFAIVAGGSPTLSYQWRRDGLAIRGAAAASYTLPVATMGDNGARYTVVASNGAGAVASLSARLTVTPAGSGSVLYTPDRIHSPINESLAERLRGIAAKNPALRGNVFMKVGDSITAGTGLLGAFGTGHIDNDGPSWETNVRFDAHPELKPLVQFLRTGMIPAGGTVGCLERASLAARAGETAGWATTGNPSPLQQEIDLSLPRYAVIMYGSNDIGWYNPPPYGYVYTLTQYQNGLLRIVDGCIERGVIPILTTMPPHGWQMPQVPWFTGMARSIAQGRRIPLVDYNRAAMAIGPEHNYGLSGDGVHPRAESYNSAAWLDAGSLHYGVNSRNLVTLEALARVKALIVDRSPAPDAVAARLSGSGTPIDPYRIPGLPFADFRNTQDSSSTMFSDYAGSTVSTAGPECVYRLVLNHDQKLRILALDKGTDAVRLYLLDQSGTPAGCLAADDAMIAQGFVAGTYFLVVDSRAAGGEFSLLVQVDDEVPVLAAAFRHDPPGATSVRLVWAAATSNEPIARYAIYRDDQASAMGVVDGTTLEWTDTACAPATDYSYQLVAIDASGDVSARSVDLAVRTP